MGNYIKASDWNRLVKDSIAKTADNALVGYFNMLRRAGGVSLSERYKLLLLWFFNNLKNDSDFLQYYDDTDEYAAQWKIDRDLENKVNNVFYQNIQCLSQDTCNIRLIGEDCIPVPEYMWYNDTTPTEKHYLLVLNDTDPIETSIEVDLDNMSWQDAFVSEIWSQASGFIIENKDTEEEEDPIYLGYEVKSIT